MEILINNSEFKLTEISYLDINDTSKNKSILESHRYLNKGIFSGPANNTDLWTYITFNTLLEAINVKKVKADSNNRYFIIERGTTNIVNKEYTNEEIGIMSGIARVLISEHSSKLTIYRKLELLEGLLRSIGRTTPLTQFYTFGIKLDITCQNIYKALEINNLLKDEKIDKESLSYPLYRGGKRYSIYELVNDLIEDNSFILDTKNFKLISPKTNTEKISTSRISDEWCRVLGKTENKKRANISISFLANILAEIPENNVGIEPGPMHLTAPRKICIIKDGLLINPELIVKVNSKKLQQKLVGAGIIKERLLYNNELALDLTKLPIINRNKLKVNIFDVAQTEVRYTISSIACEYLERRIYMRDKKLEACPEKLPKPKKSEKEKYLESLGIYGSYLNPTKVKTEVNSKYLVNEISGKIYDMSSRYYSDEVYRYCNSSLQSKCNPVVKDFLTCLDDCLKTHSLDELNEMWIKKHKEYEKRLRDLKFRLLFGRTFKFKCLGQKKLDYSVNYNKITVPILLSNKTVSVGWKFETKNAYNYDFKQCK